MDAITDFLSAVRVQGACYGRIQVTAPWGLQSETGSHARFGLISYGQAWLTLPGTADPIHLSHGDFFLLAPGGEYILSDDLHTAPRQLSELLKEKRCEPIRFGGGGAPTAIIAGRFSFDETHGRPLTDFLPLLILIRAGQPHLLALQKTLELLASEVDASTPGSQVAVHHLADLLLIQALRAHIADTQAERTGWLHALSDAHIGAALSSMHKRIEHPWTVATLASEAGMSRSAFAQRFKTVMSESPLEYLTRWRIYRGSDLLRESDRKLADVAQAVGYDSDGAFHKAFKRVLGIAPGEYRRSVGATQPL
ncbi:MAG: Transcriptional regulator, AraC family protein [Bryobacterales bacterium]|jgi:AraC-like DNA-binding protein|nr:Transcriptional regulator, AraC family protein [Bryobacterales bacterium]